MTNQTNTPDDSGHASYWRANIKILLFLIAIWFFASFGLSIIAVDWLDQFKFMGFPFGFWMAQQGSIIVFLLIIFYYGWKMNRVDKSFGVEEEESKPDDFDI
jgi:putative solute:sodium symporter small subunit